MMEVDIPRNDLNSEIIIRTNDKTVSSVIQQESIAQGERLTLSRVSYFDINGYKRCWEGATRIARRDGNRVDSVTVLAFYKRLLYHDCIILVKKFRPALKTYTIEMVSGLVQENEGAGETALRELYEHTNLFGAVKTIGTPLSTDPNFSNCMTRFVTVNVDGDNPMNRNPKQSEDPFKETIIIPVSELRARLIEFAADNYIVDSRLEVFAIGSVMGNVSRKSNKLVPTCVLK
ncbi:unnamed protein product [Bemisia tabaci]|uniref:Nudix hydrolase domain-containing protein n=1 Tax=Bemisia tabaci TaxID=7038 RepID=A0A9P0A8F1_BEMTA|nr:PREDICTED: ADP-sugar pyrophosphatase-like [Bemisia tabaci]CAH0385518.1 unnamed protein product [Bemisia tabaci]